MSDETIKRINEQAEIFAYDIDPKYHKGFEPIHRKNGYIAGAKAEHEHMEREHIQILDKGMMEFCRMLGIPEDRIQAMKAQVDKLNPKL